MIDVVNVITKKRYIRYKFDWTSTTYLYEMISFKWFVNTLPPTSILTTNTVTAHVTAYASNRRHTTIQHKICLINAKTRKPSILDINLLSRNFQMYVPPYISNVNQNVAKKHQKPFRLEPNNNSLLRCYFYDWFCWNLANQNIVNKKPTNWWG